MFPRLRPSSAFRLAAAGAALCAWACLQSEEPEDFFRLEAGPSLMGYTRVAVRLEDTTGRSLALLYDDTLPSLAPLARLPVRNYSGGKARICIEGYRGNTLAYRETRLYEGRTQQLLSLEVEEFGTGADRTLASDSAAMPVHAPTLPAFPRDTAVSIRDSVPLAADAADADGDLASYAWECEGNAGARDSAAMQGFAERIRFGARFADPGKYLCRLRVRDARGQETEKQVQVTVDLDPPWADAGSDTTVAPGSAILLHARGEDGYGPIVTRSWSIGGGAFQGVPQIESSIRAPADTGDLPCVLRVTDSDGLAALDTLIVHVRAPSP